MQWYYGTDPDGLWRCSTGDLGNGWAAVVTDHSDGALLYNAEIVHRDGRRIKLRDGFNKLADAKRDSLYLALRQHGTAR